MEFVQLLVHFGANLLFSKARIVAIETTGSDSMYYSVLASENPALTVPPRVRIVKNEEHGVEMATLVPTSRATSLGASWSAPAVIKRVCSRRAIDRTLVTCVNIPDELAMNGCLQFAGMSKPSVSSIHLLAFTRCFSRPCW